MRREDNEEGRQMGTRRETLASSPVSSIFPNVGPVGHVASDTAGEEWKDEWKL